MTNWDTFSPIFFLTRFPVEIVQPLIRHCFWRQSSADLTEATILKLFLKDTGTKFQLQKYTGIYFQI